MGATRVSTGDLDKDGYDDILLSTADVAKVFLGDASGPSTSAAITFSTAGCGDTLVQDIDDDGHLDVVLGERNGGKSNIYLGSRTGPDTTSDYALSVADDVSACEAGDINGDGYTDVLLYSGSGSSYRLYIFEGNSQGWSDSRRHADITHDNSGDALFTADLDKDGYEDILQLQAIGGGNYRLKVWYGDTTWPSTPDIVKVSGYDNSVVVAMPKEAGGTRAYRGKFLTEPIALPSAASNKWDMLDLSGEMPRNTSMRLSVLDGASGDPIAGYDDLTDWNVDLAGIDPDLHWMLQVEVTVDSEFNTTTPVLDRLLVTWMDRRVWRDLFYGAGKVDQFMGLQVSNGEMGVASLGGTGPQIIFPAIVGDEDYTPPPLSFMDAGNLDYLSWPPREFIAKGTSAVDVTDVDGDGYPDILFAVHRTTGSTFGGKSPLFAGSPLGPKEQPVHSFNTVGAMDVVLRDLDYDGFTDVVFAQERNGTDDYAVNSSLFWGSADGWSDEPDVEFVTMGASGVEAVDVDHDGLADLVFACYRGTSHSTDSMVFIQDDTGFNGSDPTYRLTTHGARAVASGDLNRDGFEDLVFANSFKAGFTEVDSYIYWGASDNGFARTPTDLPTSGAMDVKVADVDRDRDLDIVFANSQDNSGNYDVGSAVYLNDGSGGFGDVPDIVLSTTGAVGVDVADIDRRGWLDLVFSCERNATTHQVPSLVYFGGTTGWGNVPGIRLPTEGASDAMVTRLFERGEGGYLSVPIALDDPARETGTVHTFRYSASLGPSISGTLRLVDKYTWEVLGETRLKSGDNEWDVRGLFSVRKHPAIRVMVVLDGLESGETFSLDDLWMNWTKRVWEPPEVLGLGVSQPSVLRQGKVDLWLNVSDDYDLRGDLVVEVQHRVNGTDVWDMYLLGTLAYDPDTGSWGTTITTRGGTPLGSYDFRVTVSDLDGLTSPWREFGNLLEVLNNIPTAPVVRITPERPRTTSALNVEMLEGARDADGEGLTYIYRWYRDGVLYPEATTDSLVAAHTSKGENWSVEVVAFDGNDEGPAGTAWVVIGNAPPFAKGDLPSPEFPEDTVDSDWLDLSDVFEDPDGDPIEWHLAEMPENMTVTIDPVTGVVTLEPDPDWFGYVNITFVASDGEFNISRTTEVHVVSVNDVPWVDTVDGLPPDADPMFYTVDLGETLTIIFTVFDVEGDEVQASVNTTAVVLDEGTFTMTFDPGTEAVGMFHFGLRVWDVVEPMNKHTLGFFIVVVNPNDPMEDPVITQPADGFTFKANQSFSLVGEAEDPDIPFGQELEFIWSSDLEGELGRGASIVVMLTIPGTHTITLTVKDPDFTKTTTITLVVEPEEEVTPPPPPDDNGVGPGTNWALIAIILVVLVIVGVAAFLVAGKRRTERYEARMDAEEEAEEKRLALERTRDAIRDVADKWESEAETPEAAPSTEAAQAAAAAEGWEMEDVSGEDRFTMEAELAEMPSAGAQTQWESVDAAEAEPTVEDQEARRVEDLKRTYQNAIGTLPFGVPSKELAGRDWVYLANALVTGEKRTLPDGREITLIEGRWYYSDPGDQDTLLKEHREAPEPEPPKAEVASDREQLLAKLEERFIMGEISEETYNKLLEKYGQDKG